MAQGHERDSRGGRESGGRCLASIVPRAATEASNSDDVLQNQDGAHRARRAMGARESGKMLTALEHPRLCVSCPRCQRRLCIECNEAKGLTECPMCSEASPRMKTEQCFLIQGESPRVRCLNVHALGEQWIEKVTAARVSGRAQNEGEHLEFRAHITGWEMEAKKSRCDKVLTKSDCNLRRELLEKKDVLLILHDSCPEHTPLDETPGWWYVPTEEILGRVCKKCNALRVLSEFTSRERDRKNKASCRKCKPEGSHGGGRSGLKRARTSF